MNKPVHLGLSTLELSKVLIYEFCYDYTTPKSGKKAKLWQRDTDFIIFIKILQKMFKQDLTLRIMNQTAIPLKERYQKGKIKNYLD